LAFWASAELRVVRTYRRMVAAARVVRRREPVRRETGRYSSVQCHGSLSPLSLDPLWMWVLQQWRGAWE
jgi:hypothetical protein